VIAGSKRMETVKADKVAAILTSLAAYGGKLAEVFHNHSITAGNLPRAFKGTLNIFDAIVDSLKQVLSLVKDEVDGRNLFSRQGLEYVHIVALECATTLAKIGHIVAESCLEHKEHEALMERRKKASSENPVTVLDPTKLNLDGKDFFDKVEGKRESGGWRHEEMYGATRRCACPSLSKDA
jgi:hypothetical protein